MYVSKNRCHMEPICFQALCSFQGREFWKWSWLKSFGIFCSYLSTKGTLQSQFWKERSGFKLLNFLNQEIEELGQKSVVNTFQPEFRVVEFQFNLSQYSLHTSNDMKSCQFCDLIHCSQIFLHCSDSCSPFLTYEVHIFVRILKLGSTLLL